jgi:hypothetical protein
MHIPVLIHIIQNLAIAKKHIIENLQCALLILSMKLNF